MNDSISITAGSAHVSRTIPKGLAVLIGIACASSFLFFRAAVAQMKVNATHPNGEVALVVDMQVKPGAEAEFEEAFRRSVTCTRLEPGNIEFNVHKSLDGQGRYVLYEIWRSAEALESHFEQPYTKALFATFDRTLVRPVSDGGLRFVSDLAPAQRTAPARTSPASRAECR